MGALRMIVYIPMMISPLVVAYAWRIMLDGSFGVITWFGDSLGFEQAAVDHRVRHGLDHRH
jgi:ABC-type sugar transport system permease subunit